MLTVTNQSLYALEEQQKSCKAEIIYGWRNRQYHQKIWILIPLCSYNSVGSVMGISSLKHFHYEGLHIPKEYKKMQLNRTTTERQ